MYLNKIKILLLATLCAGITLIPNAAKAVSGDVSTPKVINTSPLWADSGQSYHACNVVNVTTGTFSVKIDLINSAGSVLQTSTQNIAAGKSVEVANSTTYSGFARCRFTVSNQDWIRGNITVFRWMGSYFDSVAIDSAR